MKQVKILIVEDERITAERVRIILETRNYKVTACVASGKEAIKEMEKELPDLLLMDIRLNGKIEGIITAQEIKRYYPVSIIYITEINDEEIFQQAKETFPKNYISKPFSNETLVRAVELAIQHPERIKMDERFDHIKTAISDRIFIQTREGFYEKLLLTDILFIESKGSSADIYFVSEGKNVANFYHISLSSNNLVERLQFDALIRVHKSFYVNMLRIENINYAEICLHGSARKIPLGRDFKNEFNKILKSFKHNSLRK